MDLSPIGRACLIAREGRRLMAYTDSVGVLTIGIGCTEIYGKPVQRGQIITAAECDALFETTVARYVAAVNRGLKVSVSQHAFDALVSVCYNIGIGTANPKPGQKPGFLNSTFLRRINAGDMAGARDAILMWKIPAAIITRRQAEAEQFVTPYAQALPRATVKQKPISVPVVTLPTAKPLAPAVDHPAQTAPVLVPVVVPPAHPWLTAFGGWFDRVFAPTAGGYREMDTAARG